jgi:hypothetical protein
VAFANIWCFGNKFPKRISRIAEVLENVVLLWHGLSSLRSFGRLESPPHTEGFVLNGALIIARMCPLLDGRGSDGMNEGRGSAPAWWKENLVNGIDITSPRLCRGLFHWKLCAMMTY